MSKETIKGKYTRPENKNSFVKLVENDVLIEKFAFTAGFFGLLDMLALSSRGSSEDLTKALAFTIFSISAGTVYNIKNKIEKTKPEI